MGDIGGDFHRALFQQGLGGIHQRSATVAHVVEQDAAPAFHFTDDIHHFGHAGLGAALVDDGDLGIEQFGQGPGADHTADIRRHDHQVIDFVVPADVIFHHLGGEEIVRRDVEKALDLAGMQIDGQNAVGAGLGDQIGHQLGGDRRPATGLAVLAGIAEIGDDGGDPARTGTNQGVDDDQQFHQMVVRRRRGRLDDEDILAAHILIDPDEDFAVSETLDLTRTQGCIQIIGNRLGQISIGRSRHQFHGWWSPAVQDAR